MTTDNTPVTRALFESSLFSGLSRDHFELLKKIATPHSIKAGAPIFLLGQEATELFIIATGRVALQLPLAIRGKGADITIEEKGPGQVIAWSALVPPNKLTLTARAAEATTLVGLRRDDLHTLYAEHPEIHRRTADNLCRVIASRVSVLEALLMRDLQRWVVERYG